MRKRSNLIFLLLAFLLTIPAVLGVLHSGFFPSDDGNWMVIRFSAFFENLRNGEFPVRFLSRLNNGYGYPVADFLYPLFMYIGVPIHLLKVNFVDTIKIIFTLSMLASSVFSFLWLRKLFDNVASLVGSLVYAYAPYHLYDLYRRGSAGEVLALSIVPFIFWQIERKSLAGTSFGIAFLILSHNTLAVLFLPGIFLYMLLDIVLAKNKKEFIYKYTSILVLGFCLSAFFWIPAVYDLQYTVFSKTQISDWSKYFSDLSLIGLSTVFIIILIFASILLGKIEIKKHRLTVLLLVVCLVSIFLSTSISSSFWNILPVSFIQFPFRLLSLTMFCVAFLAACVVSILRNTTKIIIALVILFLVFISAWPFLFPKNYQYYPDTFYSTNQDSTTVKNEYMPKWVSQAAIGKYLNKVEIVRGLASTDNIINKGNKISFNVNAADKSIIQINAVYFPGWEVFVDGKSIAIDYNSNGLMIFDVSRGNHVVVARFGETQMRMVADVLSLLGLLLVIILFVRKFRKA